jgi:hypothetical protein
VGVLVYGVLIYFLRVPEVERTIQVVKKKVSGMVAGKEDEE